MEFSCAVEQPLGLYYSASKEDFPPAHAGRNSHDDIGTFAQQGVQYSHRVLAESRVVDVQLSNLSVYTRVRLYSHRVLAESRVVDVLER